MTSRRFTEMSPEWVRKPNNVTLSDGRIEIITESGTDLWQRTYYGFTNDNAPVLQAQTDEKYFSFIVKTQFASKDRFDQCGVAMYLDSDNWFKASIEYEDENYQRLGSVVTNNGYSDWATTDISSDIHKAKLRTHKKGGFIMKKTKIIAGLMSAIMSGALAVVPTVYAEDDISVPFSVTIDNPDLTTGYFSVIFKNDYSKEMIENSIIPELINSVGENLISNIIYYNTYYNADNFYTTDTTVLDTEYIERDVYIVELKSDDKVTAYDIETAFSKTGYFHYIDAVNFFMYQFLMLL